MRAILQRVSSASVSVDNASVASIQKGYLILLGIEHDDHESDGLWLAKKVSALRVFPDEEGLMNKSIIDVNGSFLVVSQFTLHASYKKGTRPSFIKAAKPNQAEELYLKFCAQLKEVSNKEVFTGQFGAHMEVSLVNDGPVTIIIDTKNKE